MKTITSEGIELDLISDEPKIDENDVKMFAAKAGAIFGIDYFEKDSAANMKIKVLFEMLIEDGWTKKTFQKRCVKFFREERFSTWTPAHFLAQSRAKLYPYSWYLDEIHKNRSARFEVYKINGVFLYKFQDGVDIGIKNAVKSSTEPIKLLKLVLKSGNIK